MLSFKIFIIIHFNDYLRCLNIQFNKINTKEIFSLSLKRSALFGKIVSISVGKEFQSRVMNIWGKYSAKRPRTRVDRLEIL